MVINFGKNLEKLASMLDKPLYVVGGAVRNYVINKSMSLDVDLAAAISPEEFCRALYSCGLKVTAEYKRMGTVMFNDGKSKCEFTAFRKEKYVGGEHTPYLTEPTDDIIDDAKRRDFKCNAVYYDIRGKKIVDPLGGLLDIENKVIDTVIRADEVFRHDGLRLLRLARFAGELGFSPTHEVLISAKNNADNVKEISPERIYDELKKILVADKKYPFSPELGHYKALKILDQTHVLDKIFPELTDGRDMAQRADFHKYDVLEHGLRSAAYADEKIRLAALLHDVGKPFCYKRDGMYYYHYLEGVRIAQRILKKLKVDKKTIDQVKYLTRWHMIDLDCSMPEQRVRKFLVEHYDKLDQLLLVKQADFRASLESDEVAPTLNKWKKILEEMKGDGTPFSIKELKVDASDLIERGYVGECIGKELKKLLNICIKNPKKNDREKLLKIIDKDIKAN